MPYYFLGPNTNISLQAQIDNSAITDTAQINDRAMVFDSSVKGESVIYGHAIVQQCNIRGKVQILGNSRVTRSTIMDETFIGNDTEVTNSILRDNTKVSGYAILNGVTAEGNETTTTYIGSPRFFGNANTLIENIHLKGPISIEGIGIDGFKIPDFQQNLLPHDNVGLPVLKTKRPFIIQTEADFEQLITNNLKNIGR